MTNSNVKYVRILSRVGSSLIVFLVLYSLGSVVSAVELPGERRSVLPDFVPPKRTPTNILPIIPLPSLPSTGSAAAGTRLFIREYRFIGNTVFDDSELAAVSSPYTNREVSFAELQALRDQLTLHYVERGYINSGAVIPPQNVTDGRIEVHLVEGSLSDVAVETDGRFRPDYFRDRLIARSPKVVNVQQLEEQLQLFLQDPRVKRIDAEFVPGKVRGEAILQVHIEEEEPARFEFRLSNDVSPSVGGVSGRTLFNYDNPFRRGDRLELSATVADGLKELGVRYELPLTLADTLLELEVNISDIEVVEEPFEPLDIEGRSYSYTIGLRQPFYRSLSTTMTAFIRGEYRKSSSFLFGEPFAFSQGTDDGVARVSVIRAGADWTYRDQWQVMALRTNVSVGLNVFGATHNQGNVPDGEFVTWLGQVQWARRLGFLDSQLLLRLDAQLSNSALLAMEQFTIGGEATVRGYREKERVTDNGVVGSIEWRVPMTWLDSTYGRFEIATFIDAGNSWNYNRGSTSPHTLVSAGLGLRWRIRDRARAYLYWANSLREISQISENDLQDDGIHFGFSLGWK